MSRSHQDAFREQDEMLDVLSSSVSRQKSMASMIGQETEEQLMVGPDEDQAG